VVLSLLATDTGTVRVQLGKESYLLPLTLAHKLWVERAAS